MNLTELADKAERISEVDALDLYRDAKEVLVGTDKAHLLDELRLARIHLQSFYEEARAIVAKEDKE